MKKTFPQHSGKRLMFFFLCFYSFGVFAQNITVTGLVTDTQGESLIGVTIQVQGTTQGTVTDFDGKYTLTGVPSDARLEVSYVGMQGQVINVNGRSVIDITLLDDTELLKETSSLASLGTQIGRAHV